MAPATGIKKNSKILNFKDTATRPDIMPDAEDAIVRLFRKIFR
jgi:hypothetical protein